MKALVSVTFLFFALLLGHQSWSQNHFIESFESPSTTWSGYTTGPVTFPSGVWDFVSVFPESSGASYDGSKACRINDDEVGASITSPAVNGVGTVSFYYHRPFGGTGSFTLEKKVGMGSWEILSTVNFDNVTTPTLYSFDVDESANDVQMRIVNDDNTAHLTIDYFIMGEYSSATNTEVEFVSTTSSIAEDGTSIDVCVSITNEDATNATTVEIALDGVSTATNGTDYDDGAAAAIVFPQTITFPAGSSTDQCLTFHITDDMDIEGDESVILNLQNPGGGNAAALGTTVQHALTIVDNDFPTPELVITEIMYNTPGTDDEWIEICNITSSGIDISSYEVRTNGNLRATIPAASVLAAGECITVAVGDNDDGTYNPDCPFTPDFGTPSGTNVLSNSSGTVTFETPTNDIVDQVYYTTGAGANGNGASLHVVDATMDNSVTSANWQEVAMGGSPGVNSLTPVCNCTATLTYGAATCDAITPGVDTYTATFEFTIGSETEALSVTASTGTPDVTSIFADGTITVTGVDEGTDVTLSLSNTGCNLSATVFSPDCDPVCTATLTAGSATCDAVTPGTDTYTATFEFVNGTESETLSVSASSGTPDVTNISADGTITVTGINEGTDVTLTVSNTMCNLMETVSSPFCDEQSAVRINEVDSSPSEDEFIELFGAPGLSLSGLVVVLFNGNTTDDASYDAFDLDGHVLDANGYFIIGKSTSMPAGVDAPEIVLSGISSRLQDGVDAVGLYTANESDFPNETPATSVGLIDVCVYDGGPDDDLELRTILGFTAANGHADSPINEAENGERPTESVQRGSWFTAPRTPRAENEPLPVQLLTFNVEKHDKSVLLTWQTAAEVHNDYFSVEWSRDGKSFEEIEKVKGQENSRNKSVYNTIHANPVNGINYYRLSQVDLDGSKESFPIKTVTFDDSDKGFSILPTLVNSNINIQFSQKVSEGSLLLFNSTGRLIKKFQLESGIQGLEMDMSPLSPGPYFIQYVQQEGSSTERFVKL